MLFMVIGYVLGSIPFGLLLTKFFGAGDIRTIGSGNIGATNVLRTGKKGLALATLLLDAGKGALAVWIARYDSGALATLDMGWFAGLAAILGHMFPVWLKGKGGKGVATSFAVLLVLAPVSAAWAATAWALCFFFTRVSSLAAISAIGVAVIVSFFALAWVQALMVTAIGVLVLWRHKANIERLLKGEEKGFGRGQGLGTRG